MSITLDRKAGGPVVIYSPAGGMAIEEVAKTNPEQIFTIKIDTSKGLSNEDLNTAAKNLGLEKQKD